jgi:non-specific serine/threonine protein kinase/serine/threonine-protein kinase
MATHNGPEFDRSPEVPQVPDFVFDSVIVARAQNLLATMPERVEQYRIIERIGGGGMGDVYIAEQDPPVQRKVALKVIKAGMDTFQVVGRFDNERQALALMNHPNIATVYDAGATDAGRPFFVMEWVDGIPITEYCDNEKLSIRQRLEMMIPVCQAVRRAHQKGIIHRDLKPHNVLVTSKEGNPKVIDFGIAKAIGVSLNESITRTDPSQLLGTPAYMSPEQLGGQEKEIDTRIDVYGLGVLIYELVTGSTPLDTSKLPKQDYAQFVRAIRDSDPVAPGARLRAKDTAALAAVAKARSTSPFELKQLVNGELDSIIMTAIEKSPGKRYQSVAMLEDDLRRFLAGDPISVGARGTWYRLGKFARRHKVVIAFGLVLLTSLLLGITGTTIALVRENHQRHLAEAGRAEVEIQRSNAQAVIDFLDNDLLAKAKPEAVPDNATRNVLVNTLIDPAIATVDDRLKNQPLAQASVRETLAEVLWSLGSYDKSLVQARAALNIRMQLLGEDNLQTIQSIRSVAWALSRLDRISEAVGMMKRAVDRLGQNRSADALTVLNMTGDYASFLLAAGRAGEAMPFYARNYEQSRRLFGDDNPLTIQVARNYAAGLSHSGHADQAEPLARRACDNASRVFGEHDPRTLQARDEYANVLSALNRFAEAESLRKQLVALDAPVFGIDHPVTVREESDYAMSVSDAGRYAEAKPLARAAYEHARRVLGNGSRITLTALNDFVAILTMLSQFEEAEPLARQAWQSEKSAWGAEDPDTVYAESNYAVTIYSLQRPAEAEPLLKHVWEFDRRLLGDNHPETQMARTNVAAALRAVGRAAEAAALPGAPTTR